MIERTRSRRGKRKEKAGIKRRCSNNGRNRCRGRGEADFLCGRGHWRKISCHVAGRVLGGRRRKHRVRGLSRIGDMHGSCGG
jgi:hypothetical protein